MNKKVAFLMLCHILPVQINDFIKILNCSNFDFFLHVDKKSDIQPLIHTNENVYFITDNHRVNVQWGKFSMVQATIELVKLAKQKGDYDYFWLCSGQDFPVKSVEEILRFFKDKRNNFLSFSSSRNFPVNGYCNTRFDKRCEIYYPNWIIGKSIFKKMLRRLYYFATGGRGYTFNFIKRNPPYDLKLYFGSQWWCLNKQTIEWLINYIDNHSEICNFYKHTLCPDESFFQTLVMASPYAEDIEDNLVYVDWSLGFNSPKVLSEADYERILKSEKLLARKINSEMEPGLYNLLNLNYA